MTKSKVINVNIERRLGLVCPVIAASAMGFTEIVRLLIAHKADINKVMKSGHTALHFAAVEGHLDIVILLLDAGEFIYSRFQFHNYNCCFSIINILLKTIVKVYGASGFPP